MRVPASERENPGSVRVTHQLATGFCNYRVKCVRHHVTTSSVRSNFLFEKHIKYSTVRCVQRTVVRTEYVRTYSVLRTYAGTLVKYPENRTPSHIVLAISAQRGRCDQRRRPELVPYHAIWL